MEMEIGRHGKRWDGIAWDYIEWYGMAWHGDSESDSK